MLAVEVTTIGMFVWGTVGLQDVVVVRGYAPGGGREEADARAMATTTMKN